MIIVDEEHDSSFKQQSSTIRYNARDVAIYRASQLDIPIVLGSATPSIESYFNCKVGKYELLKLKSKALNNFSNEVRLIDLKSSIVDNGICSMLFDELGNNINAHSQSLVFINKLGFAKALVCKAAMLLWSVKNVINHIHYIHTLISIYSVISVVHASQLLQAVNLVMRRAFHIWYRYRKGSISHRVKISI